MAISKLILFYVFTPLPDPQALRLWQRELCQGLGLTGRLVISVRLTSWRSTPAVWWHRALRRGLR